ncbi:MAG: Ig-like domain-containing protein [Thermoplasmatota archaeon]
MRKWRAPASILTAGLLVFTMLVITSENGSSEERSAAIVDMDRFIWDPYLLPLSHYNGKIGTILHVGGSGGNNYTTVQDGINASADGDLVLVHPGLYIENVVVNRSVVLRGEGFPTIRARDNDHASVRIESDGVTIEGFNVTGSGYGMLLNASGADIRDVHFFRNDVHLRWEKDYNNVTSDIMANAASITDCYFNSTFAMESPDSIEMRVNASSSLSSWNMTMGAVTISNNTFLMREGNATALDLEFWTDIDTANLTSFFFEGFNISDNYFLGGGYGVLMRSDLSDINGTSVVMGRTILKDNEFHNIYGRGIDIEGPVIRGVHGNSVVSMGEFRVSSNNISGSGFFPYQTNIRVILHNITGLTHNSIVTLGSIEVSGNVLGLGGMMGGNKINLIAGIQDLACGMSGDSRFSYNGTIIEDNLVNGRDICIYPEFQRVCVGMSDGSRAWVSGLVMDGNRIMSQGKGICIHSFNDIGTNMAGSTRFQMGNIEIDDNIFYTDGPCIDINRIWKLGNYLNGTANFTMGELTYRGNYFNNTNDDFVSGLYGIEYIGYQLSGDSSVSVGRVRFNNNTLEGNDNTARRVAPHLIGRFMDDNSTFRFGGVEYIGNTYINCHLQVEGDGVAEHMYDNTSALVSKYVISDNTVNNPLGEGIWIGTPGGSLRNMEGSSTAYHGGWDICNNNVTCRDNGIQIGRYRYYCSILDDDSKAEIGKLRIFDNVVNAGTGIYIHEFSLLGSYNDGNSSAVVGEAEIFRNSVQSDYAGFLNDEYLDIGVNNRGNSMNVIGRLHLHNNSFIGFASGIIFPSISDIGSRNTDTSSITAGFPMIRTNSIKGGSNGIDAIIRECGNENRQNSRIDVSGLYTEQNSIEADNNGIFISGPWSGGCSNYDNSTVTIGSTVISGNEVISGLNGVMVWNYAANGHSNNDGSSIRFGGMIVRENSIESSLSGFVASSPFRSVSSSDNSTFEFGILSIDGNEISAVEDGISIWMGGTARSATWNETVRFGAFSFENNQVTASTGIKLDMPWMEAYQGSQIHFGDINVKDNIMNLTAGPGLWLNRWVYSYDNASSLTGNITVSGNDISGESDLGLYIEDSQGENQTGIGSKVLVIGNVVDGFKEAFYINSTGGCRIYLNDFIDNDRTTTFTDPQTIFNSPAPMDYKYGYRNFNGYLGNYYSDYAGQDYDVNGIGDTPHPLDEANDSYPLFTSFREYFPVHVDTTPPNLEIISPANNSYFDEETVTVRWRGNDSGIGIERFEFRVNDGSIYNKLNMTYHTMAGLDNGIYNVTVKAFDWLGNTAEARVTFTIDRIVPEIRITSPANNSIVNRLPCNVTWQLVELGGNVDRVEIRVDRGEWKLTDATLYHHMRNVTDGERRIEVRVRDLAGNEMTDSVTIKLDTTPPELNILSPVNGSSTAGDSMTFKWTGEDNYLGIKGYRFSLDGSSAIDLGMVSNRTVYGLEEGYHWVNISAVDNAGNVRILNWVISVDTKDPRITIAGIRDGDMLKTAWVNISWSLDFTGSLFGVLILTVDGHQMETSGGYALITGLKEGSHVLQFSVRDGAGNQVNKTIGFTVDLTKPEIILKSPTGTSAPTDSDVVIVFSEKITISSIRIGNVSVGGVLSANGTYYLYTPPDGFRENFNYAVSVVYRDMAGNENGLNWTFRTRPFKAGTGSVTGRILDEDGNPIEGARVELEDGTFAYTDSNGYFRIKGTSGNHTLKIYIDGHLKQTIQITIPDGESGELDDIEIQGEDEPMDSMLLVIVIFLVIVIIIIVVAYVVIKRKSEEDERLARFELEEDEPFDEEAIFDLEE